MRTWASKRLLPWALALVLALLTGCAGFFDTEYYASEPYQPPPPQETEPDGAISDYAELRQALLALVADHAESAQLQFSGYDGDPGQDISAACWEVKSSTALGAFAVDRITYELSRIVSYYQADVRIDYKRTAQQTAALESVGPDETVAARLARALAEDETYLLLETSDSSLTEEQLLRYVSDAYYADPLAVPVRPKASAQLFPETGARRIAEISLDYGLDREALDRRREELTAALAAIEDAVGRVDLLGGDQAQAGTLRALCAYLALHCSPEETAGATAWDALVGGAADSEGLALALEAACGRLGLDCQVVTGRLGEQEHRWNIVTLDSGSYHVDLAGTRDVFLAGDGELFGDYWWDTSLYPACPAAFGEPEPTAPVFVLPNGPAI